MMWCDQHLQMYCESVWICSIFAQKSMYEHSPCMHIRSLTTIHGHYMTITIIIIIIIAVLLPLMCALVFFITVCSFKFMNVYFITLQSYVSFLFLWMCKSVDHHHLLYSTFFICFPYLSMPNIIIVVILMSIKLCNEQHHHHHNQHQTPMKLLPNDIYGSWRV